MQLNFPEIISIGQMWHDPNNVVWVVDTKNRWTRNTRTGGIAAPASPPDQIWYADSAAKQLSLPSKMADICIRTDIKPNESFKQRGEANVSMADWQKLGLISGDYGVIT